MRNRDTDEYDVDILREILKYKLDPKELVAIRDLLEYDIRNVHNILDVDKIRYDDQELP